jgi:hypothetical protein
MTNYIKKIVGSAVIVALLLVAGIGVANASEITGTLSSNSSSGSQTSGTTGGTGSGTGGSSTSGTVGGSSITGTLTGGSSGGTSNGPISGSLLAGSSGSGGGGNGPIFGGVTSGGVGGGSASPIQPPQVGTPSTGTGGGQLTDGNRGGLALLGTKNPTTNLGAQNSPNPNTNELATNELAAVLASGIGMNTWLLWILLVVLLLAIGYYWYKRDSDRKKLSTQKIG